MEYNKKIKGIGMLILIINFIFIIPLNINNIYAANVDTTQTVEDTCSFIPPINIKDSLIMSILGLCLPGVLEKVQELRQQRCQEVVCTYEAVKNGLDSSFCAKQSAFQTCEYIVGGIFSIPPFSMVENLRKAVAGALANPVGILWSVAYKSAQTADTASCIVPLLNCNVIWNPALKGYAKVIVVFTDTAGAVQAIKDIVDNGFWPSDSGEDYCSEMEDITKEMEEIMESK